MACHGLPDLAWSALIQSGSVLSCLILSCVVLHCHTVWSVLLCCLACFALVMSCVVLCCVLWSVLSHVYCIALSDPSMFVLFLFSCEGLIGVRCGHGCVSDVGGWLLVDAVWVGHGCVSDVGGRLLVDAVSVVSGQTFWFWPEKRILKFVVNLIVLPRSSGKRDCSIHPLFVVAQAGFQCRSIDKAFGLVFPWRIWSCLVLHCIVLHCGLLSCVVSPARVSSCLVLYHVHWSGLTCSGQVMSGLVCPVLLRPQVAKITFTRRHSCNRLLPPCRGFSKCS